MRSNQIGSFLILGLKYLFDLIFPVVGGFPQGIITQDILGQI